MGKNYYAVKGLEEVYKSILLQTQKKRVKGVRNSMHIGFLDVLFVCRNLWIVNDYIVPVRF